MGGVEVSRLGCGGRERHYFRRCGLQYCRLLVRVCKGMCVSCGCVIVCKSTLGGCSAARKGMYVC